MITLETGSIDLSDPKVIALINSEFAGGVVVNNDDNIQTFGPFSQITVIGTSSDNGFCIVEGGHTFWMDTHGGTLSAESEILNEFPSSRYPFSLEDTYAFVEPTGEITIGVPDDAALVIYSLDHPSWFFYKMLLDELEGQVC